MAQASNEQTIQVALNPMPLGGKGRFWGSASASKLIHLLISAIVIASFAMLVSRLSTTSAAAQALPDLTNTASVSGSFSPGQNVAIPVTVNRTGGPLPTSGTYVLDRMFFSTNSTFGSSDIQIWESNGSTPDFPVSVLNSTGTKTVTPTVQIPSSVTTSGTYYIIVYVDPTNFFSESNEGNNITARPITVNVPTPPPNLSSSPPSAQQLTGTFTVTGNNYTPNGTVRRFIIPPGGSQQEISTTTANGSGNVNWTFSPACSDPVGTTTLWAVDASTNRQSNNVIQNVTANPSCSSVTLISSPPSAQQLTGTFTVTGSNYTPNGTVRRFIIPPGGSQQEISTTTANSTGNVNWTFSPACSDPVGTTTLWAVDASTNRQSNNVTQTVTTNPSCAAVTLSVSPASGSKNGTVFTYDGDNYTPNGIINRFLQFPDGHTQQIASITANNSGHGRATFTANCADQAGTYTVHWVDATTSRSSNNVQVTENDSSQCTNPVDAAAFVQGSVPEGAQMAQGQRFTATWTIRNSGTTTWNLSYKLRWAGGSSLSNHADIAIVGTVSPGSNYTFFISMTAPTTPGSYREDWRLINPEAVTINVGSSPTIWVSIQVGSGCNTPLITTQPVSGTFSSGFSFMLFVDTNNGKPPLTYQWYQGVKGDTSRPISGAISSLFTTPQLFATASYWVRVSSACGASVNSDTATITVGQAIEIVDPLCDSTLRCQGAYLTITPPLGPGAVEVVQDVSRLAMANVNRYGIVADGVSLLLLRVHTDSPVSFSLSPGVGTLMKKDGSLEGTAVFVEPEATPKGKIAFALYKAPINFSGDSNPSQITIRAQIGSGPLITRTLSIYRPPVMLVHGIWGEPSSWYTFADRLRDGHFDVCSSCIVDYSGASAGPFDPTQPSFPIEALALASRSTLSDYRGRGIAISKVDVIAHSMGGLVTRARAAQVSGFKRIDNYYAGDFHKIITIGTPHFGTPLANWLIEHRDSATRLPVTLETLFEIKGKPFGEAVSQLQQSSTAIQHIGITTIPMHAIVGVEPRGQVNCGEVKQDGLLSFVIGAFATTDGLLGGEGNHDNLVPIHSQSGGVPSTQIFNVVHSQAPGPCKDTDETHSPDVIGRAIALLNTAIGSKDFADSNTGAPMVIEGLIPPDVKPPVEPPSPQANTNIVTSAGVSISPAPGLVVHPGEIFNVTFAINGGDAVDGALIIAGDDLEILQGAGPFSISFTVPSGQVGKINITALTFGSGPENYEATTYVIVAPNESLSIVEVSPTTVSMEQPGQHYQLRVTGQLANGTLIDLTPGAAGTSYSLASSTNKVISVSTDGLVEGRAIGEDTIMVTYSGITYTVNVTVGDSVRPRITGASINGEKLMITGENFDDGAKILLDGDQQKSANDDQNPATTLIGKKAGKFIAPGQTVVLMVRNSDGLLSNGFSFTRPQ